MVNRDAPLSNSPYDEKELEHFKQLLDSENQEAEKKVERLRSSLDNLEKNAVDEHSSAAHHQADVASEEDEREKLLIMIGKEEDKIGEVNAALDRIGVGTYGICQDTGKKIKKGRLEAVPYARYSVDASNDHED